jgi:two-component system phosphate regulon sensor histidine kinase PhoR
MKYGMGALIRRPEVVHASPDPAYQNLGRDPGRHVEQESMSEIDKGTAQKTTNLAEQIVGRIVRARYVLAVAVLALALVLVSGVSFPVLLILGIILLLAVVAFAPGQASEEVQPGGSETPETGLSRFSGVRLAVQLPDPMILFDG